jgi:hypothetical protein
VAADAKGWKKITFSRRKLIFIGFQLVDGTLAASGRVLMESRYP